MEEKELYEKFGRLTIQLEIVQAQINEVKQQIAAKLNEKRNPAVNIKDSTVKDSNIVVNKDKDDKKKN